MAVDPGNAATKPPWELRLFLSADLAGSTAFKQKTRDDGGEPEWVSVFTGFHQEFPKKFARLYFADPGSGQVPAVWKRLGDEIVFSCEITEPAQVLRHVNSFWTATKEFSLPAPLAIKPCAWFGGFPVTNRKIEVGRASQPDGNEIINYDYLGPWMDIGFRLAKFADRRRFVLSTQVAHMLASMLVESQQENEFNFGFDGQRELRGVTTDEERGRGAGYPLVYIDMRDDFGAPGTYDKTEADIMSLDAAKIGNLLTSYFKSYPTIPHNRAAFISPCSHPVFGVVPPELAGDGMAWADDDRIYDYASAVKQDESEEAQGGRGHESDEATRPKTKARKPAKRGKHR